MSVLLKVILGGDGSQFDAMLNRANAKAKVWGEEFQKSVGKKIQESLAPAGVLVGLEEIIRRSIELASRIKDQAEQTQLTTDEVQRLALAAHEVGLEFSDVEHALSHLGQARKEAAKGNEELLQSFERYKITLEDLQDPSQSNLDLLQKMAKAMRGLRLDPAQRQELRELYGKGGDKLPALFEALEKTEHKPILSSEEVENIDSAAKGVRELIRTIEIYEGKRIGGVAKMLRGDVAEGFLDAVGKRNSWLNPLTKVQSLWKYFFPKMGTEKRLGADGSWEPPGTKLFDDGREAESAKRLLAVYQKITEANKLNLTTDEKRKEALREIKTLMIQADELEPGAYNRDTAEGKADQIKAGELRAEAFHKVKELQGQLEPQDFKLHLNNLQQMGARVNDPARDQGQRTAKELVSAARELAQKLERLIGQTGVDSYPSYR